ncbi:GNAT family N-acetyltransferase [Actinoplanes xinjiangensis]|uniref:GNAT family N-acetyltransferase n=1 Tax=Actinoplanes xinjiangensis TaxID=512350 RepID=UPI00342BA293
MRTALVTPRLRLDACTPADAAELHALFSDPLTHTIGSGPFTALDQTERWIRNRMRFRAEHGLCWYAVRTLDTGTLIGNCGLLAGRTWPAGPELGYLIGAAHQRRGYASEAAIAVVAECRASGMPRLWATIRPHNEPSRRIAERLGLRLDHTGYDERGALDHYAADLTS